MSLLCLGAQRKGMVIDMNKKQLQEFVNTLGAIAEMTLIFYRDVIKAGGTQEEAMRLTQAFVSAFIFGGKRDRENGK